MISNLDPLAGTQPQLPFVRPIGDDHESQSRIQIVAGSEGEFYIGDLGPRSGCNNSGTHLEAGLGSQFLIRRIRGDKFLIWNRDHEMLETDAGKLESELRDFFNEEF